MKKEIRLTVLLSVFFILLGIYGKVHADTGWSGAVREENGQMLNTGQVTVSSLTSTGATLIVTGSVKNACIKIHNLSTNYRVALGSSTSVTMSTGYVLDVDTISTSVTEFHSHTGNIYGFGEGTGLVTPTVSWGTCGTNQ